MSMCYRTAEVLQ